MKTLEDIKRDGWESGINEVWNGDCLEIMKYIPDRRIDMILADLPYGTTACKWDTIIPFEPLWEQYKRIIKDNGAIVLTASQPFTSALVMSNPDMFKVELIWEKEQGTNQMLKDIAPLKIHENILVFRKERVNYYPQMTKARSIISKRKGVIDKITGADLKDYQYNNQEQAYPTSILFSKRELNNRFHPTQKPVSLFAYLIKTYTNEGDLVLDNVAGSGTTGVACKNLNRNFILIEKEKEYCDIAEQRIKAISNSLF